MNNTYFREKKQQAIVHNAELCSRRAENEILHNIHYLCRLRYIPRNCLNAKRR